MHVINKKLLLKNLCLTGLSIALAAGTTVINPISLGYAAEARMSGYPSQFSPTLIADVAERIAPSVVNIDVSKTSPHSGAALPEFMLGDEIFRRFFGIEPNNRSFQNFKSPQPQQPQEPHTAHQHPVVRGNGSGMILGQDGTILTNGHVVAGAENITVTLNDGRAYPAKLIGEDKFSDIAVLKIDAPNLKPIQMGNSDTLRPGEWVIAVGSPLGFDHTVTQGIISALSRRIPDLNSNISFIQTDAAINPGNSGGPLVDLNGRVIGINTAISGHGQNIGFAIPVNTVKEIANTLIAGKSVVRPWIGISMITLNPELAKQAGLSADAKGVMIAEVMLQSPAYKAGLMQGDVIQKIEGVSVSEAETIQGMVRKKPVQSRLNLEILRNGHPITVGVLSEELPQDINRYRHQAHPPKIR